MFSDFSHTLFVLQLTSNAYDVSGHNIGNTTSRVSDFKLGRVFALFSPLTQWRLVKSICKNAPRFGRVHVGFSQYERFEESVLCSLIALARVIPSELLPFFMF